MNRRHLGLFVALCATWGSSFVALKIGLRYADPVFLASLRFWIASIAVLVFGFAVGKPMWPSRDKLLPLVLVGVSQIGFLAMFLNLGQDHLSAGLGAILFYTYPLLAAVAAAMFLNERIDRTKAAGLALGFGGVVLLTGSSAHGEVGGMILVLAAAVSWAVGTVLFKRMLSGEDTYMVSAWTMVFGSVFLSIASLVIEGAPHVEITSGLVTALLYQAIPAMAMAGTLWLWLLDRGEAAVASAYLFMTPVFGVFFGWLLLDERITWMRVAGGVLVGAGIYLVNRTAKLQAEQSLGVAGEDRLTSVVR